MVSPRTEYRIYFLINLLLSIVIAIILGAVFGSGSSSHDVLITQLQDNITVLQTANAALQTTNAHLNAEVMSLMMDSLTLNVTYIQNGTCTFGFPVVDDSAIQTTADYSDFVTLNYTLKELLLSPSSVPITVLEISATPRPIVFSGYTPAITLPKDNDLQATLALFDPPIASLDSLASNSINLAYSYTVASRIVISPNCVAMTNAQHDSSHCTEENANSPYFTSSYPTTNSVTISTNNLNVAGDANLQFLWGQWDYSSLANQYDFTGTTLSFSAPLQLQLPNF